MLKWKSQEMTKANTIQAKRKFRNQCPFRQFRVSGAKDVGTANTAFVAKSLVSIVGCTGSTSFGPTRLRTIELQISHTLKAITISENKGP
nr:conserved hypothetical protein [Ipomoea batatas]